MTVQRVPAPMPRFVRPGAPHDVRPSIPVRGVFSRSALRPRGRATRQLGDLGLQIGPRIRVGGSVGRVLGKTEKAVSRAAHSTVGKVAIAAVAAPFVLPAAAAGVATLARGAASLVSSVPGAGLVGRALKRDVRAVKRGGSFVARAFTPSRHEQPVDPTTMLPDVTLPGVQSTGMSQTVLAPAPRRARGGPRRRRGDDASTPDNIDVTKLLHAIATTSPAEPQPAGMPAPVDAAAPDGGVQQAGFLGNVPMPVLVIGGAALVLAFTRRGGGDRGGRR